MTTLFQEIQDDKTRLFEIILAASFLDIKGLYELGCYIVANKMNKKTPAQIRQLFNLEEDLTPEEVAKIRKDKASYEKLVDDGAKITPIDKIHVSGTAP